MGSCHIPYLIIPRTSLDLEINPVHKHEGHSNTLITAQSNEDRGVRRDLWGDMSEGTQDQLSRKSFTGLRTEGVVCCTNWKAPWGKLWFMILGHINKTDLTWLGLTHYIGSRVVIRCCSWSDWSDTAPQHHCHFIHFINGHRTKKTENNRTNSRLPSFGLVR